MFETIERMFGAWRKIYEAMEDVAGDGGVAIRSLLCMTADYVAAKEGIPTTELLEELLPTISDVNAVEGVMPI